MPHSGKYIEAAVATRDTRTVDQHVANACATLAGEPQPFPRVFDTVRVPVAAVEAGELPLRDMLEQAIAERRGFGGRQ